MKKIFVRLNILVLFVGLILVSAEAQQAKKEKTSEPVVIQEGKGVLGLAVGQSTRADVVKKLGENYELVRHIEYSYEMVYHDLGLSFYTCQSDGGEEVFVITIRPPFKAKTESGIILGESSFADVVKLYGETKDKYNNNYAYKGIEFYHDEEYAESTDDAELIKQKKVIGIHIVESTGLRQCDSKQETFTTEDTEDNE